MAILDTKPRRSLAPSDVEELGTVGPNRYVRYREREYVMGSGPMDAGSVAAPVSDGEIRIAERKERVDYGTVGSYTATIRGTEVPTGTYTAQVAREAKRRRAFEPKARQPLDLLARMPALAPTGPKVLGAGSPVSRYVEGARPSADVDAVLRLCEREGVSLSLAPAGKLLLHGPAGRATDGVLGLLRIVERLVVGRLSGRVVPCECWHVDGPPAAVTMLALDVAACADHASGALPIIDSTRAGAS